MTYGGTNWGWLGIPENYTSYDYGAAIRETRQLDPKYYEDKLIGYFTHAVTPITKTDPINALPPDNPAIIDTARINPDTRHAVPRPAPRRLDLDLGRPHAHRAGLQRQADPGSPTPTTTPTRRCTTPAAGRTSPTRATPAATTRTPSRSPTPPGTR